MRREDIVVRSGGQDCAGWLYHADTSKPAATVVMAHGLAAVKEMRLDVYAERFARAGYHVLVFDYRHFGASARQPRQLQTTIGSYNEVGVAIPVYPKGKGTALPLAGWTQLFRRPDQREQGMYIIDLPVTTQIACAAGREFWGCPKFATPISFTLGGGRLSCCVEDPEDGSTIMEISGAAVSSLPVPALPLVLYSMRDGELVRATVEPRGGMRAHLPSGMRLKVGSSHHRMAENLRGLGLDGARPIAVLSTTRIQSRLNAGGPINTMYTGRTEATVGA